MIKIKNDKINLTFKKISCGHSHSLLLSEKGVIYAFGRNDCGQLGIENVKVKTPKNCHVLSNSLILNAIFQVIFLSLYLKVMFFTFGVNVKKKILIIREK
jgi:alpha-tubulin suppressor-like RCC1 family protein